MSYRRVLQIGLMVNERSFIETDRRPSIAGRSIPLILFAGLALAGRYARMVAASLPRSLYRYQPPASLR